LPVALGVAAAAVALAAAAAAVTDQIRHGKLANWLANRPWPKGATKSGSKMAHKSC